LPELKNSLKIGIIIYDYYIFGTDTISGNTCPYEHEKTFRKKREVTEEKKKNQINLPSKIKKT
jgi:hypothetical protein